VDRNIRIRTTVLRKTEEKFLASGTGGSDPVDLPLKIRLFANRYSQAKRHASIHLSGKSPVILRCRVHVRQRLRQRPKPVRSAQIALARQADTTTANGGEGFVLPRGIMVGSAYFMTILSDFFVASPEQALRYANRSVEPDGASEIAALLRPAAYRGFTTLQLGMLWAMLEGVAWNVKRHKLENIWWSDDGEAWLNRFPDELTRLLADASADQLAATLVKWAGTEEVGYSPDNLAPVLNVLQTLAKHAVATNASVYLWGSM
jgi:hypothetical protein